MNIQELQTLYAMKPQVAALAKSIEKSSIKTISLDGLLASAIPMTFSALAQKVSS